MVLKNVFFSSYQFDLSSSCFPFGLQFYTKKHDAWDIFHNKATSLQKCVDKIPFFTSKCIILVIFFGFIMKIFHVHSASSFEFVASTDNKCRIKSKTHKTRKKSLFPAQFFYFCPFLYFSCSLLKKCLKLQNPTLCNTV